jgi:hypothetical protein
MSYSGAYGERIWRRLLGHVREFPSALEAPLLARNSREAENVFIEVVDIIYQ